MNGSFTLNPFSSPFDDLVDDTEENTAVASGMVHLRLQQRNARQRICTVQGLSKHLNFEKIKKSLMKQLCCNGIVVDDPEHGKILQFQGDHRAEIAKFLVEEELVESAEMIKIHGH